MWSAVNRDRTIVKSFPENTYFFSNSIAKGLADKDSAEPPKITGSYLQSTIVWIIIRVLCNYSKNGIQLTYTGRGIAHLSNEWIPDIERFRNINCKAPGSSHDAAVFRQSNLFRHYNNLIPQKTLTVDGTEIPFMIMGDPAYPLLPWLIKGYTRSRRLTPQEESFNVYLNSGRVDVELAFGRLKARWRRLLKRVDVHWSFVPHIVAACCTLHNIVEFHKQEFRYSWMKNIDEADVLFPQPDGTRSREYDDLNATEIRNVLMRHVSQFPLRRSFL